MLFTIQYKRTRLLTASYLPMQAPTTQIDTSNWKTYHNAECGFSLQYPPDWKVEEYSIADTGAEVMIFKTNPTSSHNSAERDFYEIEFLSVHLVRWPPEIILAKQKEVELRGNFSVAGIKALREELRRSQQSVAYSINFVKDDGIYSIREDWAIVKPTITSSHSARHNYEALKVLDQILLTFRFIK